MTNDPVYDAQIYYDRLAKQATYDDHIEELMEIKKQKSQKAVATIVRQDLAAAFTKILAFAFDQELKEAFTIADILHLDQLDMLAVENCFIRFEEILQKEQDYLDEIYEEVEV